MPFEEVASLESKTKLRARHCSSLPTPFAKCFECLFHLRVLVPSVPAVALHTCGVRHNTRTSMRHEISRTTLDHAPPGASGSFSCGHHKHRWTEVHQLHGLRRLCTVLVNVQLVHLDNTLGYVNVGLDRACLDPRNLPCDCPRQNLRSTTGQRPCIASPAG